MKRQSYFLFTIFLAVIVISCQKNPIITITDPLTYQYVGTGNGILGTKGGEVYIGNSASAIFQSIVAVKPGVLTGPVRFSITAVSATVPGYPNAKVINIQPDTLIFPNLVTIGMPYHHLQSNSPEWIRLCSYNPTTGKLTTLEKLDIDSNRKIMYGKANQLGFFSIIQDEVPTVTTSTFSDSRDNEVYRWVKIDNQVWMAENLRFNAPSGSWCYNNSVANCNLYGRLYDLDAAMASCPPGWHLPTQQEWIELEKKLGLTDETPNPDTWKNSGYVGMKLKSLTGWTGGGNGTNAIQFNAIPAGFRDGNGSFDFLGISARFWTSSYQGTSGYWGRYLETTDNGIFWTVRGASRGFSVRCIQGSDNSLPVITTANISQISSFSAVSGGTLISQGGSPITNRGVCWNTLGYPLISDSHTSDGTGVGSFSSQISPLLPQTVYYVRAYATNASGTAYGEQKSLTTLHQAVIETGTVQDSRDFTTYKTAKYGEVWWMAENLNFTASSGSYCYNGLPANCITYGRLYEWNSAMSACPPGWYLPTDENWKALEITLGMTSAEADATSWRNEGEIGVKMKSASGWSENGNGNNSSKFTALPGGFRDGDGTYGYLGQAARFWTSTPDPQNDPWVRYLEYNDVGVYRSSRGPSRSMSVRCVKGTNLSLPMVMTGIISNIGDQSATCTGEVINAGGSTVTSRGFCWNTTGLPTITGNRVTSGSGMGAFNGQIPGLNRSTTYFIRAYATNSLGTSYGEERTFTTTETIPPETGTFLDNRNMKTYKTVKLGTQWWFAENLAYEIVNNSWCYNNVGTSCNDYGRLYNYDAAITACPAGWHLPSDAEWKSMEISLGMSQAVADDVSWRLDGDVGTQLKSVSGWINNGNGSNSSLFNALPAGFRDGDGTFYYLGESARFWTRGVATNQDPFIRYLLYNKKGVYRDPRGPSRGFSVRCVRD